MPTPTETPSRNGVRQRKRGKAKDLAIIEGALTVFGERGYAEATIAAICSAAGVSDATLYEYFESKEDVLFSIAELYTTRELERMRELEHYLPHARERLRAIIQGYLEFYESNRLYTSVALLTLKGNRRFLTSARAKPVREAARTIIDTYELGVEQGVFRDDLDPHLVRSLVLGAIEHLTIQWLMIGRPETIADKRDIIFDMVMRAVGKPQRDDRVRLDVTIGRDDLERILSS